MMLACPLICPTHGVLASDLSELIGYHFYGLDYGYVDVGDDLCQELQVDHAVQQVKS